MSLKTIKGIREEKWAELKSMSAKNRIPMGKLVENMIDAYSKHTEKVWDIILHGKKNTTDKEAEEMRKTVFDLRKEKWFKDE